MEKIIITAGDLYTDIDVLACAIAYNELLHFQNIESSVILRGPFNKSIIKSISDWNLIYDNDFGDLNNTNFIIVDISEPDHIASFVNQERIVKLFDHHYGFENYWRLKYGDNAIIERVGACATLIWEEYQKVKQTEKITQLVANLMSTAIISNTLFFKSAVTTDRDYQAYNQLKKFTDLPTTWVEQYFREQEIFAFNNPYQSAKEDTISITINNFVSKLTICQIELWNSGEFLRINLNQVIKAVKNFENEHWMITSPSISEGKNYLYSESEKVQNFISQLLHVNFNNNLAITDRLILRKEIKKEIMDYQSSPR